MWVHLEALRFRRMVQRGVTKPVRPFAELAPVNHKTISKSVT